MLPLCLLSEKIALIRDFENVFLFILLVQHYIGSCSFYSALTRVKEQEKIKTLKNSKLVFSPGLSTNPRASAPCLVFRVPPVQNKLHPQQTLSRACRSLLLRGGWPV